MPEGEICDDGVPERERERDVMMEYQRERCDDGVPERERAVMECQRGGAVMMEYQRERERAVMECQREREL